MGKLRLGSFNKEIIQDSVGNILVDSASIDFTYDDSANTITAVVIPAGVDHGGLGGLADDDHLQYHTDARGDARYFTQTQLGDTDATSGSDLIGDDATYSNFTPTTTTVKGALSGIDTAIGAASTPPGGATTQVQFNNAGVFAGDADLTWTPGTNTLRLGATTESVLNVGSTNGNGLGNSTVLFSTDPTSSISANETFTDIRADRNITTGTTVSAEVFRAEATYDVSGAGVIAPSLRGGAFSICGDVSASAVITAATGLFAISNKRGTAAMGSLTSLHVIQSFTNNNITTDAVGVRITGSGGPAGIFFAIKQEESTAVNQFAGTVEMDGDLDHDGSNIGFFGTAPAAQRAAYTQTFATATRTHAAFTSATLTDSTGGAANTTVVAVPVVNGSGATTAQENAINDNFADLIAQVNALRVDLDNTKQVLNSTIDDDQTYGLAQ